MKIYIDQKAVKRNALIGKFLRWISLGCMLIGLIAVFSQEISANTTLFSIFFSIMIVGVLLSSVSAFFTTRYGKSPRPDEMIDKSFKGFDDRYQIFHYQSSIPHLLVGPAGIWSITPTFVDGEITFDEKKNNWIHKKNSLLNRFLSKEYFPNPVSDLKHHQQELEKIIGSSGNLNDYELNSLVILMHRNVKLTGLSEKNNIFILPFEKVKDRFRKMVKNNEKIAGWEVTILDKLIS
ncbi:MAG: NERD domain-containing protein [Anaerolineaceae bacterium]|nr:NERD domain-containing protein [Anaerolineaceae bacterium]